MHMPVFLKNDYILMQSISATAHLFKGITGWVSIFLFCMWTLKDIHQKRVMEMSKFGRKKKKKKISVAKSRNFSCSLEVVFGLMRYTINAQIGRWKHIYFAL